MRTNKTNTSMQTDHRPIRDLIMIEKFAPLKKAHFVALKKSGNPLARGRDVFMIDQLTEALVIFVLPGSQALSLVTSGQLPTLAKKIANVTPPSTIINGVNSLKKNLRRWSRENSPRKTRKINPLP